jgi:hypothetical protein
MIRELISEGLNVRLNGAPVGRLLRKKLGFGKKRPTQKSRYWLKKKKRLFSIRSDYYYSTTWSPVGQTPAVETTGTHFSVKTVSAVSAKGSFRFMTF